ncbi:MAG: DAK2 domain-containing protein [Sarcina ventriculi]|uniref:Dihydroxyacetone kinase n=1 Tax=Sarcina ventriculi TaxID=1267 RepID=A0ABP2AP44_SARVE|nr:DAK2 domain-containing protein [Sarcina ventriculi]MCI5636763.1 DAK2 domain-containing protein [Sarcina ventriculi]MDD7373112.1 DAK2 domain-containing protein [Sarcina ventriculi]MDY7063189.1 DAK2 domain-containing protein [Sarcina ventriculi]CUN48726.1 dihydroxyacetone kinase [Sarcina ventriculi]
MNFTKINGGHFYSMMSNAALRLEEKSDYVNSLNVFPVPDGDTGTNMSMTFRTAVKEISETDLKSIGEVSKKMAKGALMGARGNSGVILSQILRGISKGLENKEEVDSKEFANAILEGSKAAYKAVMRPTEGTILTVIKSAGETAIKNNDVEDIASLMKKICIESKMTLDKTPEMLPALKKAKVVDSGGMGLLIILQGMLEALNNNLEISNIENNSGVTIKESNLNTLNEEDIKFGYCTEFIILGDAKYADDFRRSIENMGDSEIVVGYDDIIKVHIHTNDPGKVLSKAVLIGELSKIKIDNMREEHRELLGDLQNQIMETSVAKEIDGGKKYAFVSIAMGEGIANIFEDLGVDKVIEGGQTMNPSTQDILKAIDTINAEHIIIFPNNKNIIMAANQAAEMSDKDIRVVPTKTIPQGITCITMFNGEDDIDTNMENLNSVMEVVKTASVTYAVRDTEMDGKQIKEGDILGLIEGKISEVGNDVCVVARKLLENLVNDDSELITIFKGKDMKDNDISMFINELEEKYSNLDVQYYNGDQPLYYMIMSVE